jgi:hypothetical protein
MDVWGPRCWAGIVGGRGVPRDYCFIQSNLSTDNVDRLDMDWISLSRMDMDWIDPLSYPYPIRSEPYPTASADLPDSTNNFNYELAPPCEDQ